MREIDLIDCRLIRTKDTATDRSNQKILTQKASTRGKEDETETVPDKKQPQGKEKTMRSDTNAN